MNWKKLKNCNCGNPDVALLLMRLMLALGFIVPGWMKFNDLAGTAVFFAKVGLPGWLCPIIAFIELFGGLAMLLGVATHWAGKLLALNMLGAVVVATWPQGGLMASELPLAFLVLALGISMMGPGKYTFAWLMKRKA